MPVWVCSCLCGYFHAQAWMDTCLWMSADNIGWNSSSMCYVWLGTASLIGLILWQAGLPSWLLNSRNPSVHLPTSGITTTCYCAWIWKPKFINSLRMSHTVVWSRSLPTSPLLPPSSTSLPVLQLGVLGFSGQRDRESLIVPPLGALIWVTSHCDTWVLYVHF